MRIVHTQFGPGEIREVQGGGAGAKISVAFEHGGVRKLLLKYAGKELSEKSAGGPFTWLGRKIG